MGFACSVLDSSLAELKQDGVINDVRVIQENHTFHVYNKTKTRIVNDVYKVDTKGKLLYNEVRTASGNYVAEPVKWIFDEVQKVKDQLEVKQVELANTLENIQPDSEVKHFIITDQKSNKTTGLSTKNFLNTVTDVDAFISLQNQFFNKLGKTYRPYDKSAAAKRDKNAFYKFLGSKGYIGMVVDEKFAISFEFDTADAITETNKMAAENMPPQLSLFDEELEPVQPVLNGLESLGKYSNEEVSIIMEEYTEVEINEMMSNNPVEATQIFNEYLFNKIWENSTFVPKEIVNQFNRICK